MTSAAEEVLNGMGHLSVKENENDILVSECRPIVCEIRHERTNSTSTEKLQKWIIEEIRGHSTPIYNWCSVSFADSENLHGVSKIIVSCTSEPDGMELHLNDDEITNIRFYHYSVKTMGPLASEFSLEGPDEESTGSVQWELPSMEFDDLWENLIYNEDVKNELISYVPALLDMSAKNAKSAILDVNRLILLYGPPGTGKTSLCKALVQRLSVRLSDRFKRSIFLEVNSHSLFSKWFSESAKFVAKLFSEIQKLSEQSNWLIFVLIDEVESLTIGRNAAFSGTDPSDSVRSVNAVLTQLDRLKRFPNVFVLATSNIFSQIDSAFIDRVDLAIRIEQPSCETIFKILISAMDELQRVQLITPNADDMNHYRLKILQISKLCSGLSGRALRKLPILAYARCYPSKENDMPISIRSFLDKMERIAYANSQKLLTQTLHNSSKFHSII